MSAVSDTSNTGLPALISLLIEQQVLQFGEFTLKSGRSSPYFFNLGELCTGAALAQLAESYAQRIIDSDLRPTVLFGPAYKGIPLAVATATAMAARGQDVGITFNRKERKAHGEGGHLVGAALAGERVLLLDDVLTAGTAMREAIEIVRGAGGDICGVLIAMDRQERGSGAETAVAALAAELKAPVLSLLNVTDVVRFLDGSVSESDSRLETGALNQGNLKQRMEAYQAQYCVAYES
ncbi:MAG: orotate phosphoribosyltransferase [Pseudomonadales bacterium]